ncbi:uncharacterized protein [Choristoneura fumiferana]|uniref:uncharacterized protein n=1 Tax=Choristoneura fumiferana TaxID=7141 RepID=UPI003D154C1E
MDEEDDNTFSASCDKNSTPKKRKVDKPKKRSQKYTNLWEKEYTWLTNDPENSSNAKCKICGVIFCISSAGIGHIKQHQETKMHKCKTEAKKTSGVLDKFLTPTTRSEIEVSDREKITAAELALTYHTVKHNLSYNSMDCTVKLNKIIYVDSSTAISIYLARTKMEALVCEVLGPYALQHVIDDLNTENLYFCLQSDASNKKNIKLFPLVVQYFTAKNGIENKLIDFYENSNESADGMFQAIQESMALYQLPFDKISGLSADNTNSNFGVNIRCLLT